VDKYGCTWPNDIDPITVEMKCIQNGGKWRVKGGGEAGAGLYFHYRHLQKLLWPDQDHHRWSDLVLKNLVENDVTAILGPKSSGKTHVVSKFGLTDYFCFPEITTILISSTTLDALELRIWGEIKKLYKEAIARFPWLPGNLINYKHCLVTDNVEDDEVRDFRNGIIGIPCLVGGKYVGLGKYVGIKNKRVKLLADEAQFMGEGFLNAISNLDGNPDFKAAILGNPIDPLDQLGRAAEPEVGWSSLPEPTKTAVWKTRFHNGMCVNLVGTDSPNFDDSTSEKPRYKYLIDKRRIDNVSKFWGKDSHQYFSQCVGVMKQGLTARRVITRQLCVQHNAFEVAQWGPGERKKVYACDAAYSGTEGDRCVGGWIEIGYAINGVQMIKVYQPKIIPVAIGGAEIPEDQIAEYIQQDISEQAISPSDVFYDSTGRGTLGSAFARIFGTTTPVPVEFGGRPSIRPVRHDLFIVDSRGQKRLKRCDEHYSKFVSELWYSVRYVIESEQMRELPEDVAFEGYQREYKTVMGNKIEVETKDEMKERTGRSPDLFDWLATAIEGARQRGFKIQRLGIELEEVGSETVLDGIVERHERLLRSKSLSYK
jgi:hypothetical protein